MKTKLKILKDTEIKKIQDVFDEVKDEPNMVEADFFFDDTYIFSTKKMCQKKIENL